MTTYYSEEQMAGVRDVFEAQVMAWPGVTGRVMFGCPAYRADGTIFALLITGGLALTRLDDQQQAALAEQFAVRPFVTDDRVIKKWAVVPIRGSTDLDELWPSVRQSYKNALEEAAQEQKGA